MDGVDLPVLTNLFWQASYGESQATAAARVCRHSSLRVGLSPCMPSLEPPGGTISHPNYPVKTNGYRTPTFRMRCLQFCIHYYADTDTCCTVAKLTELRRHAGHVIKMHEVAKPCRHLFAEFRCHRQDYDWIA